MVLEIPLHEADAAYQVLGGMPDPARENWFGVARLIEEKPKARAAVSPEKRLMQQAGILCGEPLFQQFLAQKYNVDYGDGCDLEATAADAVRRICVVGSRSEITPGSAAAVMWQRMHEKYEAWKLL